MIFFLFSFYFRSGEIGHPALSQDLGTAGIEPAEFWEFQKYGVWGAQPTGKKSVMGAKLLRDKNVTL